MAHGFRGLVCGHWSVTWEDLILVGACGRGDSSPHDGQEAESDEGTGSRQNLHRPASKDLLPQLDPPTNKVPKTAASTEAYSVKSLQWFDRIQTKLRSAHLARLEDSAKLGTVRLPPPLWLSKPPMLLLPSSLSAWHCPQAHTQGWGSALIFRLRDALNTPRLDSRIP